MQLFFNAEISNNTSSIRFSREESKHIVKVLRKKNGDTLYITNGKGGLFEAKITLDLPNKCEALIVKGTFQEASKQYIHIAIAPTKMNERLEWFLEKATEIGIQEITPLICEHSERKNVKLERLTKIIQSACKQALQYHLPKLNEPKSFKSFVTSHKNEIKLIAHCEPSEKKSITEIKLPSEKKVTLLIGPEGDFSTLEIEMAKQNGYTPVTLGETRLRTETAGIVGVALLNLL